MHGYTGIYRDKQASTGVYRVSQKVYKGLQAYTKVYIVYRGIKGFVGVYKGIQGLQGYTGIYRGIEGF